MSLIDIRLVVTQILGFLILLWALRKWAWAPVLGLLEQRRQAIAGQFAEAERRQGAADQAKARWEQELRGIEAQARQRIQEAMAEGQKLAGEIRTQAHADAQARLQRAEDEIVRERQRAKELVKQQIISLAVRSTEKILREQLDEPHHRKLVDEFLTQVEQGASMDALAASGGPGSA
jgi:F-type H+-transporting ATPase subunit b